MTVGGNGMALATFASSAGLGMAVKTCRIPYCYIVMATKRFVRDTGILAP